MKGGATDMTTDIVERAEAACDTWVLWKMDALVKELVSELKAARAETERLRADAEMWRSVQSMYQGMGRQ